MKLRIVSRQISPRKLRRKINLPFRATANFGVAEEEDFLARLRRTNRRRQPGVVLNPPTAVLNAADKRVTKQIFTANDIPTAQWWEDGNAPPNKFPVIVKPRFGSRGRGIHLCETPEQLAELRASQGGSLDRYVVERYKNYRYEYRLHATRNSVFIAHRKAMRNGVPDSESWKHSYHNSVWFTETNPEFRKPACWDDICDHCTGAIAALGLDFGALDVKVNNAGTKFFILEVNTAPAMGEDTLAAYQRVLPELATTKHQLQS